MMDKQMNADKASFELADVKRKKQEIVSKFRVHIWHDPILGVLLAVIVIHHAFPMPWNVLVAAAGVLGITLFVQHYTNQDIWVDGWRKGRTLWVTISFLTAYLIIYAASIMLYQLGQHFWILPTASLLVFILTILFGRLWMTVWRNEMNEEGEV